MDEVLILLGPRLRGLYNRWARAGRAERGLIVTFAVLGVAFWGTVFGGIGWLVTSFYEVEVFGPILTRKLLELLCLSLFGLLCFSNVVTALSTFYLADDLELVLAMPVARPAFHAARLVDTIAQSSWMMGLFGLPVFVIYGVTYSAGWPYYALLLPLTLAFVLIPASFGVIIAGVLVSVFPARRLRELLAFVGIMALAALFVGLRLLRPERLMNAESFENLAAYVAELQAPIPMLVPPRWMADTLLALLQDRPFPAVECGLLISGALAMTAIGRWITASLYDRGRSRAQEARAARLATAGWLDRIIRIWTWPLPDESAAVVEKDVKTFFRDPAQWSQLLLLAAIIVITLVSVSALPHDMFRGKWGGMWRNTLGFLVLGLVGFVMSAVAARFQFPAVSHEGRAFWLVRTSPISAERFLWAKIWPGLVPMLVIGEILAVASTRILGAGDFLVLIAAFTALVLAFGISGIAVGIGALYPDFRADNAARVAAGPTGMLFMVASLSLVAVVVALEAVPVYLVLSAGFREQEVGTARLVGAGLALVLVVGICLTATLAPLRVGARRLWAREGL